MDALLALLPILIVIFLMVALRWSSPLAGLAGWLGSLVVAFFAFGLAPALTALNELIGPTVIIREVVGGGHFPSPFTQSHAFVLIVLQAGHKSIILGRPGSEFPETGRGVLRR